MSSTFTSDETKSADEHYKDEVLERQRWAFENISLEAGVKIQSIEDIYAATEANLTKHMLTCPKCKKVLPTYARVLNHMDSVTCRKRVAELNGHEYTPPGSIRYPCKFCGEDVRKCNWVRHEQSAKHKRNVEKLNVQPKKKEKKTYECQVCKKKYSGDRATRDFKRHLKSKKHLTLTRITIK